MTALNEFLSNINEFLKLALVIIPSLGLLFNFVKKKWFSEGQRNDHRRLIAKVYNNLNEITKIDGVVRAVILKAKPKPKDGVDKISYGYVLHEIYTKPSQSVRKNWNKQILDTEYIQLVKKIERYGHEKVYTDHIESKQLKFIYETQNIVLSEVFRLYDDDDLIIYISININNFNPISDDNQLTIHTCINNLKNLYKANPEL